MKRGSLSGITDVNKEKYRRNDTTLRDPTRYPFIWRMEQNCRQSHCKSLFARYATHCFIKTVITESGRIHNFRDKPLASSISTVLQWSFSISLPRQSSCTNWWEVTINISGLLQFILAQCFRKGSVFLEVKVRR